MGNTVFLNLNFAARRVIYKFNPFGLRKVLRNKEKEQIVSRRGGSPKYYIIRRGAYTVGLFSYFQTAVGGMMYAKEKGLIPVVDMQNYPNAYLDNSNLGRLNAWEYYFRQPCGEDLREAYRSRQYVLSDMRADYPCPAGTYDFVTNKDGILDRWKKISEEYIQLSEKADSKLQEDIGLLRGKGKVLGVLYRGTDYTRMKPKGHPIQPTVGAMIAKAKDVMIAEGFESIYLSTEDKKVIEEFKKEFEEKLFIYDRAYVDYDGEKFITKYRIDRKNDRYIQGMDYLMQILILTQCQGIISGICGGAVGALLLPNRFEYKYFFNLGNYDE